MSLFTLRDSAETMAVFDRLDERVRRAAASASVAYEPEYLMKQQRALGAGRLANEIRALEKRRLFNRRLEMEAATSAGNPVVDDLQDMVGFMSMASWLTRASDQTIVLQHARIRDILTARGFDEAVRALDAQLARALSTRAPDGTYQQHIQVTVYDAQIAMRVAARERDAAARNGGEG